MLHRHDIGPQKEIHLEQKNEENESSSNER